MRLARKARECRASQKKIRAASQIHHYRSENGAGAQHSDDECARVDFGDCTSSAMDYHATARECNVSGRWILFADDASDFVQHCAVDVCLQLCR